MDGLKSCTIKHTTPAVTIALDGNSVTIERGGKAATVRVIEGDYIFKCNKSHLKAKGGAEGFYRWAEKLANDPSGFMSAYASTIADFYIS